MAETPSRQVLDPQIIEILRCPVTKSRLRLEKDWLISEIGGLRYPIRDGIPVLLAEEAKLPDGIESLKAFKIKFTN